MHPGETRKRTNVTETRRVGIYSLFNFLIIEFHFYTYQTVVAYLPLCIKVLVLIKNISTLGVF